MKRAMAKAGGGAAMGMDIALLRNDADQARAADMADLGARVVVIALFSLMAIRIGSDFVATGRLTGLLLLASETLVVVLTVLRRGTSVVDRSYRARLLTAFSMMGPVLVRPATVTALAPELATVLLSAIGLSVVIAGKVSLGRSFGLMPANRGVVSSGLYRLVRHPIYMGYLITHSGFVAANPTLWNARHAGRRRHRPDVARGLRRADTQPRHGVSRVSAGGAVAGRARSVLTH